MRAILCVNDELIDGLCVLQRAKDTRQKMCRLYQFQMLCTILVLLLVRIEPHRIPCRTSFDFALASLLFFHLVSVLDASFMSVHFRLDATLAPWLSFLPSAHLHSLLR